MSAGVFWPGVAGIAAHEFAADGGVEFLPEACEVGGGLYCALVGREKVQHDWSFVRADAWGLFHAEEVLHAGGDPWRLAVVVMDSSGAATL